MFGRPAAIAWLMFLLLGSAVSYTMWACFRPPSLPACCCLCSARKGKKEKSNDDTSGKKTKTTNDNHQGSGSGVGDGGVVVSTGSGDGGNDGGGGPITESLTENLLEKGHDNNSSGSSSSSSSGGGSEDDVLDANCVSSACLRGSKDRPSKWLAFCFAFIAGAVGGPQQLLMKAGVSMINAHTSTDLQLSQPSFWVIMGTAVGLGVIQGAAVECGLDHFDSVFFTPLYSTALSKFLR